MYARSFILQHGIGLNTNVAQFHSYIRFIQQTLQFSDPSLKILQICERDRDALSGFARPGWNTLGAFAATFAASGLCMVAFPLQAEAASAGDLPLL